MSRRIVALVASGMLLALAACAPNSQPIAPARTPSAPPTAAALLARAAAVPLRDAAFTLTFFSGGETGLGLLTTKPKRLETLIGPTFDTQWGRITDGATYYEKLPPSPTWFAVTDTRAIFGSDSDSWLFFLDPLDYGHLQGATVQGAETLDGVATWHVRARWPLPEPLVAEMPVPVAGGVGSSPPSVAEDLWLDQARAYPVRVDLNNGPTDESSAIAAVSLRFTSWDTGHIVVLPPRLGPSPLAVDVRPSPWACSELPGSPCSPTPCLADGFPCYELAGCSGVDGPDNFPSFILRNTGGATLDWSGMLATWPGGSPTPPSDHVALAPAGGMLAPGATETARLHGANLATIGPGAFDVVLTAQGHTVLVAVQCHNG